MVHKKSFQIHSYIVYDLGFFLDEELMLFLLNVEFDYGLTRNTIHMGMWDNILKEKHFSVWVQNLVKSFSFVLFNYTVFFFPQWAEEISRSLINKKKLMLYFSILI